jgi:DNA-binding GntR family transcriptional regulator
MSGGQVSEESRKMMSEPFPWQSDSAHREKGSKSPSSQLVDQIVEQIEIGILFGEYKPRERLIQDKLVVKYSVERNIVRAALKKLEDKDVLVNFPNEGCRVRDLGAKNAKDLYQARFLLEESAARIAASKVTPEIISQLKLLNNNIENHLKDNDLKKFMFTHERFHQMIYEAADNRYLLKMIQELRSASTTVQNFSYSRYSFPEFKTKLLDEHKQIVFFLENRQLDELSDLLRAHIKSGVNHYLRSFFPGEPLIE